MESYFYCLLPSFSGKIEPAPDVNQSGQSGIKLNSGAENSFYNTISGNVCVDHKSTITEGDKKGILITGQPLGGQVVGTSRYNTLFGNVCVNNRSQGIMESDEIPGGTCEGNNTIAGNLCYLNDIGDDPVRDIFTYGAGTQKYNNLGSSN